MTALAATQISDEERRKEFGRDIAFGIQQTLACWATDFIDPYVGEKIQERFEDKDHHMPPKATWIGEFVGDTAAFFAFLGVQKFVPGVTRALKRATRKLFNKFLERSGRENLREWATEHNAKPDSPEYKAKMEEWKDFQADNIAKSSIISGSSIILNVGTQKAMKNTHTIGVILLAKVAGAAITVAGMLGLRFAIPKTTQTLDDELSRRYFTPVIRETQKLLGAEVDRKPQHKHVKKSKEQSHSEKITATKNSDRVVQYGR